MSIFDRLDRMASRAVDRTNGTAFTLTPMRKSANGRPGVDPERAPITARGIFDLVDSDVPLELGKRNRSGNDLRTLVAGKTPVLSVDRRYLPQEPRQGDQVAVAGGEFEVVSVRRDGQSRLELQLVKR